MQFTKHKYSFISLLSGRTFIKPVAANNNLATPYARTFEPSERTTDCETLKMENTLNEVTKLNETENFEYNIKNCKDRKSVV